MEKIIGPCYLFYGNSYLMDTTLAVPLMIPNGCYPMDVFNMIIDDEESAKSIHHLSDDYGWLTSKNRFLTQEEAADFVWQHHLVDKKLTKLTVEEFQGAWRP